MIINRQDTNGVKPLLAVGELGYDNYPSGGDTGRVYVGTGTENIALAERLETNMMSKAEFNALAEERKANRAGSGFDEWGKHSVPSATMSPINEGMWTESTASNSFILGSENTYTGISKSFVPNICINGTKQIINRVGGDAPFSPNQIKLPTAPNIYQHDTVLTPEQIASGVIKHADASNSGLIGNGKFDVDTSWWTAGAGAISDISAGKLRFHSGTNNTVATYYRTVSGLVIGKKYIVEFEYSGNAVNRYFRVDAGSNSATDNTATYGMLINESIIIGRNYIEFTPNETTCHIKMQSYLSATYVEFDNIAVFPADAISRSDLVFIESWHEDISEKNFVYPLGNVQYLGSNTDGLTGISNGSFTGFETYSLFGNWQTPSALIGKGYVWSSLNEAHKRAFIANPENNCYLDGDKVIQVRYRVRVVQGRGDTGFATYPYNTYFVSSSGGYIKPKGKQVSISSDWGIADSLGIYGHGTPSWSANLPYANELGIFSATSSYNSTTGFLDGSYNGQCFALPLSLVHRKNLGLYHNVYNPNGTKLASDGLDCFRTTVSFTRISDCFDSAKLLTASGYIGTVSGRPDGLFYDQVHESDIQDLRNSSKKVFDKSRLISREFNKLVAGTYRGKEGEYFTRVFTNFGATSYAEGLSGGNTYLYDSSKSIPELPVITNGRLFSKIHSGIVFNDSNIPVEAILAYKNTTTGSGVYMVLPGDQVSSFSAVGRVSTVSYQTTRTKSNTLLHCDIIGNPTNYPTAWKESGVFGTPLIVAEDGTTSLLPDGVKDTFKLSRTANTTPLLCLRSTDSGATWTSFTPTFSTTTNAIILTDEPTTNLVMVYYQTHTSMAVPTVNSEVLEIGDVLGTDGLVSAHLVSTLIGKVPMANTAPYLQMGYDINSYRIDASTLKFSTTAAEIPLHSALSLAGGASGVPAVKILPYLTRLNGKAYLNLVFKEMKHNGTSWGDNSKFNIVDNVSTTLDDNAQTVLIGQKTVELPYFIDAGE